MRLLVNDARLLPTITDDSGRISAAEFANMPGPNTHLEWVQSELAPCNDAGSLTLIWGKGQEAALAMVEARDAHK